MTEKNRPWWVGAGAKGGEISSEEADRLILAHHGVTPREQHTRERRFFKPKPAQQVAVIQCEHGYHHSDAPHSCDWAEHGDECPFRSREQKETSS